ncbi:hypothetical protein MFLAVUS_009666 [Mucor flavus]|uniref:Uncharacterized protein n=1 Tax=Mucor flavus TaxID=439312 RepID=A0ABP9ZAJ0_9FUNG
MYGMLVYLEEYNNGQITAFNEVQTEATYACQSRSNNSRTYLQENTDTKIEDCFRPEMATYIKKYKMFSLTPLYSFTLEYAEINIVHLKSLLPKVRRELQSDDTINEGDNENKHERATYFFSQVFDFDSVRLDSKKKILKPFEQDDILPLVALGDAVFPTSMKGTLPGLARHLVKLLKQAEYEGLLVTVPVTEYMASRT